jgi:hypothetical protein
MDDLEPVAPAAPENTGRKRRRHWRALLFAGALIVLLCVGVRWALPGILERGAAYASRHFLGLPARVGNVDLELFSGGLVLEDVSLGALPDGVAPLTASCDPPAIDANAALLHFGRISLKWSWRGLWDRKLLLRELTVGAPAVRVLREADGTINPLRHGRLSTGSAGAAQPDSKGHSAERSWDIEIQNFVLRSPEVFLVEEVSGQNLLSFSLERFELDHVTLRGRELGFGAVAVHGPVLTMKREMVFTEAKLPAEAGEKIVAATEAAQSEETEATAVHVDTIHVDRAKFSWLSKEGPLDVRLTLKASDLKAEQGHEFPVEASLEIGSGKLAVAGNLGILPPKFVGRATWDGLSFPPLLLAAIPEYAGWLRAADSSGDFQIRAALTDEPGAPFVKVSGHASLKNFHIAEPNQGLLSVSWNQLDISAREIFYPVPEEGKPVRPITADMKSLHIAGPKIYYHRPWSPIEELILAFMTDPPANPQTGQTPANDSADWIRLSIDSLQIDGGDIMMRDTTVTADSHVSNVSVSMQAFRFPEPVFDALAVSANLPSDSKLTVQGSLAAGFNGDFLIGLQDLELPPLSPYAEAAGIALKAGKATLQTKLQTRGAVIRADNDLVLNKLGVSMKNQDSFVKEFGMPVNLVLVLLRDVSGNISLKVPVQMDDKGTAISMGSIVGSATRAAILGALSSPLKIVGAGLEGIGGNNSARGPAAFSIAPIPFLPGTAEPAPGTDTRITKFVKLLKERPEAAMILKGKTGDSDRPALAEQTLLEQVRSGQKLPEVEGAGILTRRWVAEYLVKRNKRTATPLNSKDQKVFEQFLAAANISDERFSSLAKARAERIRGMLIAKGASSKSVSVGEPGLTGAPGVSGVEVSLGAMGDSGKLQESRRR